MMRRECPTATSVPDGWTTDFHQDALLFWMPVYKEFQLARRCLVDLRQHFPAARVILRPDGDPDHRYEQLRTDFNLEVRFGPRLFPIENGGAIIQNMLDGFLATAQSFLFKIDPDTVIHRSLRLLPRRDGIFGTLQGGQDYRSIQGGCIGISRKAAAELAGSGLLESPLLSRPESQEEDSDYYRVMARRARRVGLASFDWMIGWAAAEMGLPMFSHPEVYCTWKTPVENRDLQYAITHPRDSCKQRKQ